MSDWVKIFIPLLAVTLTSTIGFFLTDLIGDLRRGRTLVYSLEREDDRAWLHLANVSQQTVDGAEFNLRCEGRGRSGDTNAVAEDPCFVRSSFGWYSSSNEGAVQTRNVAPIPGTGEHQIGFTVTLPPEARFSIEFLTGKGQAENVRLYYDPAVSGAQELRLIEGGGLIGWILLNYLPILVWAFAGAAFFLVVVIAGTFICMLWSFFRWYRPAHSRSESVATSKTEIDHET